MKTKITLAIILGVLLLGTVAVSAFVVHTDKYYIWNGCTQLKDGTGICGDINSPATWHAYQYYNNWWNYLHGIGNITLYQRGGYHFFNISN